MESSIHWHVLRKEMGDVLIRSVFYFEVAGQRRKAMLERALVK